MLMKYLILEHASTPTLTKEVNQFLEDGWRLYGNPFVVQMPETYSPSIYYAQALTYAEEGDLRVVGPYDV